MASTELAQAIAVQQGILQEFLAVQTPDEYRVIYSKALQQYPPAPDVTLTAVTANGVPCEWMVPPHTREQRTLLYVHGGGYVVGSPAEYRDMVPRIARAAQARALAVDYRRAPEHPHPAAVEDAVAVYRWLLDQGVRPAEIVVAGDSAGGGLTVATLIAAREAGLPLPAAGVCISPWVDMEGSGASMTANDPRDPLVKKDLILGMAQAYLGDQDRRTPLAAPLYADLRGLPPMLIQVGTAETLLDDARRLAERAKAAGVNVTLEEWPDMIHDWHWFGSFLPEAQQASERIGAFMQERMGQSAGVA
jgi:phosphinothricin tripeptide acetyl hydrolase